MDEIDRKVAEMDECDFGNFAKVQEGRSGNLEIIRWNLRRSRNHCIGTGPFLPSAEGLISIDVGVIPSFPRGAGVVCPEARSENTAEGGRLELKKKHAETVVY